ncbi:MAG: hypothetical protein KKD44_28960 [Proteobacteria bacterium]|nr:hypothetical protein [Pseudomonadota bacterium]
MVNWVEKIIHIKDGETVDQKSIGRVTTGLQLRTDYLKNKVDILEERIQRVQIDSMPCSSYVYNYSVVYFDGINFNLANIKLTDIADLHNRPLGIAINVRSYLTGYLCDVVIKGRLDIQIANMSGLLVSNNTYSPAKQYFLSDEAGKVTLVEPSLALPIFFSIAPTSTGNNRILVDTLPLNYLEHQHMVERFSWDPNGLYTLAKSPKNSDGVFLEIDGIIQRYDIENKGDWDEPSDGDYRVVNTLLQIYKPGRFELNEYDPRVTVYYTTPLASDRTVCGIIAGKNITLNTCDIDGGVAHGEVRINSKQTFKYVEDVISPLIVKKIEFNEETYETDLLVGRTVEQLLAGTNVTFQAGSDGRGKVQINANPSLQSYEYINPESITLLNAKRDILRGQLETFSLESDDIQQLLVKFRLPEYLNSVKAISLYFNYLAGDTDNVNDVELKLIYGVFRDDQVLQNFDGVAVPSGFKNTSQIINLDPLYLFQRKTKTIELVQNLESFCLPNDLLIISIKRNPSDAYTGKFYLTNLLLKIIPKKI